MRITLMFLGGLVAGGSMVLSGCSLGESAPAAPTHSESAALGVSSVPGEFATIQAALDAAAPGTTVSVASGVYQEDLVLTLGVALTGAGQGETVIYGTVSAADLTDISVAHLTLQGGLSPADAVGISFDDCAFNVDHVTLKGFGTGVSVRTNGPVPASVLNAIHVSGSKVEGIRVENAYQLTIQNSIVSYALGDGIRAAFGSLPSQNLILTNNLLIANGYGLPDGAGLRMEETVGFVITNTLSVSNNVGLYCKASCANDHSLIWGNVLNYDGFASAGPSNLNVDPRFANAAEGDFSLLFDSPAIDAGELLWAPSEDAFGVERPLGLGVDMGPYEFIATSPTVTVSLTEVMANPLDEWTGEFVEIYNFGTEPIDVAGFLLSDGDQTDTLAGFGDGNTVLPAGGFGVILTPAYPGDTYQIPAETVLLTVANSAYLGNRLSTSDPISLMTPNGLPVDKFSFPFNPGNGISVEKHSVDVGDELLNWKASPCGSSPGSPNCASQPANVSKLILIAINEVMANPLDETTGEFIEFVNFGDEAVDMGGFRLSDGDAQDVISGWEGGPTLLAAGGYAILLDPDYTGVYAIPDGTLRLSVLNSSTLGNGLAKTDPISLLTSNGLTVIDSTTHGFDPGNGISIEKVDVTIGDIPSNVGSSTCASGSSPGSVNCITLDGASPFGGATIALTEVMANALDEDRGEFIELYNYGLEGVDLAGFRIGDGDKEEALISFDGGPTLLGPGDFALVLDAEYDGFYDIPAGTVLLRTPDTSICSGLSTNDPIRLRGPKGAKSIDTFLFPFNPGNGVSAEKLDLVIGDVPQNWQASPCNASPGHFNCTPGELGGAVAGLSTTQVTLSEIMANPNNETAGEFVELFNGGATGIDVAGWWLSDGDAFDQIIGWNGGPTVVAPGQFAVILDPDFNNHYNLGDDAVKLTVTSSTLGNGLTTTDGIWLYETNGITLVDTFSSPSNPGNGKSLEKISLTAGDIPANWTPSTCSVGAGHDNNGASPGAPNCVDVYGFSGKSPLGQACPYGAADCLSGLCAVDLLSGDNFCTSDCSAAPCPQGFECTGIDDPNYAWVCISLSGGGAPAVTLSEVLYDSPGTDTDVFVELQGAPDTLLDGLTLVGINGKTGAVYATVTLFGLIDATGYFVVAHPSASAETLSAAHMVSKKANFQNGPDSIQLRFGDTVVDSLGYGGFDSAVFAGEGSPASSVAAPGQSLVRPPGVADSDDNSADFKVSIYPTPGASNVVCGNGLVEGPEACDDANLLDGDGCDSSCQLP